MLDELRRDLENHGDTAAPRGSLVRFVAEVGPQALIAYRCRRWLSGAVRRPSRWLPALLLAGPCAALTTAVRVVYGVHLDSTADIGPGLRLFHFGGVVLRSCTLGERCVVHHQVRIEPSPDDDVGPQIGSRVWIGPHARIIGRVRVGDGATIAPGTVVTSDVPAGALVAGNPGRTTLLPYDNRALL